MKPFLIIVLLFSTCLQAKGVRVGSVQIGSTQFELAESGSLTVNDPQYARPLTFDAYGAKILQITEIRRRLFVVDENGFVYLLVLPGAPDFVSRQLTRVLNSGIGEKLFLGKWAQPYRWDLFWLNGDLEIHGKPRHLIACHLNQSDGEADIILQTYENNFSLRNLLEELDAEQAESRPLCAIFLKPLGR